MAATKKAGFHIPRSPTTAELSNALFNGRTVQCDIDASPSIEIQCTVDSIQRESGRSLTDGAPVRFVVKGHVKGCVQADTRFQEKAFVAHIDPERKTGSMKIARRKRAEA